LQVIDRVHHSVRYHPLWQAVYNSKWLQAKQIKTHIIHHEGHEDHEVRSACSAADSK
jgi:hypothetical protein